jgi:predicted amidophosphoribosyltransferase
MAFAWRDLRLTLARSVLGQDCVLCAAASGARLLCAACAADLPQVAEACPQCAGPSPGGAVCGACTTHPPPFDATIAPWRYEFPVDRLVLALKFGRRLALAEAFGAALADRAAGRRVDALVPMPLGRARLAERGFNQALEIARHLARSTGLALAPGLAHRMRDTAPQTGLPHDERAANVRCVRVQRGRGRPHPGGDRRRHDHRREPRGARADAEARRRGTCRELGRRADLAPHVIRVP